jgi:hypothetical protein
VDGPSEPADWSSLPTVALTVETLAAQPRWEPARLLALPGRCRGDLIGPWGENLARRFGADAVARVRRRLVPPLDQLAPVLTARDWLPVHAQLAVTEAIVDELLAGDMRALYPLLVEDTRASVSSVKLVLVRSLGAARAFRLAPRTFRKVYERGSVDVDIDGRRAHLHFRGSPLFAHPSWRLLQLFAQKTLLELAGTPGDAVGEDGGADAFSVAATW